METRKWLFVALLAAACVPLVLAQEPGDGDVNDQAVGNNDPSNTTTTDATTSTTDANKNPGYSVRSGNLDEADQDKASTEAVETVTKREFDITGVRMQSYLGRNFNAFCGIPYAEPPIGLRRFKQPVRMTYDGNIDATKCEETPICMQIRWNEDDQELIGSEDCLYLNVYEPEAGSPNMPVLVYFHGGGFFSGSGTFGDAGPHYFMDQDVILVTVNYRLGPLGFFSLNQRDAPGNMGLYDQVMALQWVKDYIKYFHGDRFRVTIMGEGAGGACVHLHLFSPMSRGLFSRAISQSGVAFNSWALMNDMVNTSKTHAAFLGCNKEKDSMTMKCLRQVEAEQIVNSTKGLHFWMQEPLVIYRPMVQEGRLGRDIFLRHNPMDLLLRREFHNVPWLVGVVKTPGFFHARRYLVDDQLLAPLLAKFDEYGSALLDMHLSIPDSEERESALSKMMDLYETTDGAFERDSLLQIFNDREHNLGHTLAVAYHALLFHENLYQYRFEYRGVHSMAENIESVKEDEVVNEDDLIYLLRRPALFPDFDRNSIEGKRDFQMMRRLTSIWAEFAATGHVKALHRSKRDNAALAQLTTFTHGTGPLAELVNRILARHRRANEVEDTSAEGEDQDDPDGDLTDSEEEASDTGPREWKDFVHITSENKSTCWENYGSTMWPAVKRFPFTAGNVPLLPYMSFGKGGNDTPVQFCLRYLMEFDRLIHWIQLPLEEVKLPDFFLNITTTTGGTSETSAITETTRFICPTMPVSIPAEEPQTTPPSVLTIRPPTIPMPAFPPPPPPPPPPPQPPQPSTQFPCEKEGSQTPTTQTEMELETQTAPQTSQRRYTWPRYPKPPEPPQPTYPQVDFSLPPLTTRAPADSQLPWYRPTRPGPPDHFETFTWPFASTEMSTGKRPQRPAAKPTSHPSHPKGAAPPTSHVVWSYTALLLLLHLVVRL